MLRFRLGRMQRNLEIVKRRRDTALQSHPERIHAKVTSHGEKHRRGRAACGSIGRVWVARNSVVVEGSGVRDEANAGH